MLLAIDTSTSTVTAALLVDGEVLAEAVEIDHRRHGELLAPAIEQVLRAAGASRADLSAVAVGVGPGPFTGLRVGVVTALVLGHARGIPVHGVCSLDALAHQVLLTGAHTAGTDLLVATDARRREVYWARYAVCPGGAARVTGPAVARAGDIPPEITALPCFGRGPLLYPDRLRDGGGPRDVAAGALGQLAHRALGAQDTGILLPAEPLYLRRPDVAAPTPPARPLTGAGGGR